jgi:hypothetical protein
MKTAALLAILAAAGTASAAVQTDSFSFGPSPVPFSGSDVLDKFDSNGGLHVLTQMKVTFDVSLSAKVVANSQAGPQVIEAGVAGSASATDGLINLGGAINGSALSPVLNSGDVHDFGTITGVSNTFVIVPLVVANALYTQPGPTFTINYSGSGIFGIVGGGNATLDITDFAGQGTVTVEYTYDIIPTPGAAALLGLGGLAGLRRRR